MRKKTEKKKKIQIKGEVTINISASFNNTIISAADSTGNVIAWASGGSSGFKGTRKSTPFAAQSAAENLTKRLKDMGVNNIKISIKGIGVGRESAIKVLNEFYVTELKESTPIAFNGTRLPKRRKN